MVLAGRGDPIDQEPTNPPLGDTRGTSSMPVTKKQALKRLRGEFRARVLARDRFSCKVCGSTPNRLDVHHITNRNDLPGGGYVSENGISLCPPCHEKAERCLQLVSNPKLWAPYVPIGEDPLASYTPNELYKLIGSSQELAEKRSREQWEAMAIEGE
jgi:hypothetical protein